MANYSKSFLQSFFKLTARFENPNFDRAHKHLRKKFDEINEITIDELRVLHQIRARFEDDVDAISFINAQPCKVSDSDMAKAEELIEYKIQSATAQEAREMQDLKIKRWMMNPSMQIMKYTIVSAKTHAELSQKINEELDRGWRPWGGAGFAALGMSPVGGNKYFQTLVKFRSLEAKFSKLT